MTAVAFRSSPRRPAGSPLRSPVAARSAGAASLTPSYLRRRLGVAGAVIGLAVVVVGLSSTRFADAGQGGPQTERVTSAAVVIVQPGDTLWSLAREVQPKGDLRPLVAQLSRANGGSSLRAGDRIVLPNIASER